MVKLIASALLLALSLTASPAFAATHVQSATLTIQGSEVLITGKVAGHDSDGVLDIQSQVAVTCANGVNLTLGPAASITATGGSQTFTISSYGLGAALGCDAITSATLLGISVS